MNFEFPFAARIRAERKSRKLNQAAAAALVGISREMWGKYERGIAHPSGDVIARMDKAKFDVSYILTGFRASDVPGAQETIDAIEDAAEWPMRLGLAKSDPLFYPFTSVIDALHRDRDVESALSSLLKAYLSLSGTVTRAK